MANEPQLPAGRGFHLAPNYPPRQRKGTGQGGVEAAVSLSLFLCPFSSSSQQGAVPSPGHLGLCLPLGIAG